jgi:hypothetical protein
MKTNVYLTVDTEHSMGGAWANESLRPVPTERHIFCRIDGKDHGVGWLCDELVKRNFRATFFAEMFGSLVFGKDDTRAWCQYLLERGQDVQLHTHLNYYYYATKKSQPARTDDIADLPPSTRAALLEQACELFHYATDKCPRAFRAGNWRATRELMADLATAGIILDSSYNPAARSRMSFPGEALAPNTLQKIGDVWELPLTVVKQSFPEPHLINQLRLVDPTSLSFWELRKTLDEAHRAGSPHLVAVMHSFSGVKKKDPQYNKMRPDRVVRGRVRFFLDYLVANPDKFRVTTCGDLVHELERVAEHILRTTIPHIGFVQPFARKVVQAVNSLYWI